MGEILDRCLKSCNVEGVPNPVQPLAHPPASKKQAEGRQEGMEGSHTHIRLVGSKVGDGARIHDSHVVTQLQQIKLVCDPQHCLLAQQSPDAVREDVHCCVLVNRTADKKMLSGALKEESAMQCVKVGHGRVLFEHATKV
eukprot:1154832-Pelagomonas_calceolata.AAC.8